MNDLYQKKVKLLAISCALFLHSCMIHDQPKSHFQDYQNRLQRVLKIKGASGSDLAKISLTKTTAIPKFPRKRDRSLSLLQSNMSLYEFLKLKNCPLKKRIANKNNQLGQHMQPVNGMIYEILVRKEISECLLLENNKTIRSKLQQLNNYKHNSKLNDFWQYTFGADWYADLTSSSAQPLSWDDNNSLTIARLAYSQLNAGILPHLIEKTQHEKQSDHIDTSSNDEKKLKQMLNDSIYKLENSEALGKLVISVQSSTYELKVATQLLKNTNTSAMCHMTASKTRITNQQMQYFNNLIANKFAKEIQTYLSRLSRQGDMLIQEQDRLLKALMDISTSELKENDVKAIETVQKYHKEIKQLMLTFKETIKQHVYAIQKVRDICN